MMGDGPKLSLRPAGPTGSGTASPRVAGILGRGRNAFRRWRKTRPFWGGFFCIIGGIAMAYGPVTVIKLVLVSTAVWLGSLVGVLVVVMGLFLWFFPAQRQVVGLMAVIFSVVSLLTSNYGGFLIGLIMGTVGGALGFAWTPVKPAASATAAEAPPPAEAT
jgi:hypothetical protein